jgi:dGTPase
MIADILENSLETGDIAMSPEIQNAMIGLRKFMFDAVYLNKSVKTEEDKAGFIIEGLYNYYTKNIKKMPHEYTEIAEEEGEVRAALDYISGMTDIYAVSKYEEIFIPRMF